MFQRIKGYGGHTCNSRTLEPKPKVGVLPWVQAQPGLHSKTSSQKHRHIQKEGRAKGKKEEKQEGKKEKEGKKEYLR